MKSSTTYTVHQLAKLASVSVRTLHYYDEIGLLKPRRAEKNDYRSYGEAELSRLQQILFFRELDFPLADIKRILTSPSYDERKALKEQRKLLELKRKRLGGLLKTIDATITSISKKKTMEDTDMYSSFSTKEMEEYAAEAKERWGDTQAYKQSAARVAKMSKEDMARIQKEGDELLAEIAAAMPEGASSEKVQKLIGRHYRGLGKFYDPNPKLYRGLAEMYVADPRFAAYYEKRAKGLAKFMREAMLAYCGELEN